MSTLSGDGNESAGNCLAKASSSPSQIYKMNDDISEAMRENDFYTEPTETCLCLKVTEPGFHKKLDADCPIHSPSQPQEWTPEWVRRVSETDPCPSKAIADAHNAVLADALPDERWITQQLQAANDFCLKLQKQLAAEREKVKRRDLLVQTWQDNYNDLRKELAAALEKREKAEQREREADEDALRQINAKDAALAAERKKYTDTEADGIMFCGKCGNKL